MGFEDAFNQAKERFDSDLAKEAAAVARKRQWEERMPERQAAAAELGARIAAMAKTKLQEYHIPYNKGIPGWLLASPTPSLYGGGRNLMRDGWLIVTHDGRLGRTYDKTGKRAHATADEAVTNFLSGIGEYDITLPVYSQNDRARTISLGSDGFLYYLSKGYESSTLDDAYPLEECAARWTVESIKIYQEALKHYPDKIKSDYES